MTPHTPEELEKFSSIIEVGDDIKIKKPMNENLKRFLISAGISFVTGFALVIVAQIDNLSVESLEDGGLIGLIVAGTRTGIKAVAELLIAKFGSK